MDERSVKVTTMPPWRRTLYTIWLTEFIAVLGFNFVLPFIPYYIQELGVTGQQQVALWAGLATSLMSLGFAIMAPIWGTLADQHGRKLMVERAMFGGAVILRLSERRGKRRAAYRIGPAGQP